MQIDPAIFKANDIRGRAAAPGAVLTAEVARLVGAAFGTYLQRAAGQRVAVVGYDNRNTSTALAQAASQGLQAAGCDVIDIGMVSTPLVYWSAVRRGRVGGLMVTGSHLEPAQNGFKFCVGAASLHGAAIQHLRDLIAAGDFAQGSATVTERPAIPEYIADLVQRFRMPRPLRLVIDAGNGTAGAVAPALFREWGHRVTCLYCTPDGDYPNHQPNPQKAENMRALCAKVREVRADIGIAFDGDADRIGVVDERGAIIAPDRVIALLARDVLQRCPGGEGRGRRDVQPGAVRRGEAGGRHACHVDDRPRPHQAEAAGHRGRARRRGERPHHRARGLLPLRRRLCRRRQAAAGRRRKRWAALRAGCDAAGAAQLAGLPAPLPAGHHALGDGAREGAAQRRG
ncbi:MAG: hypothetical protein M5R40_23790 [Anaerolineae bacterium]|nr:hypothetical protein [Anaerolineae bacterium]